MVGLIGHCVDETLFSYSILLAFVYATIITKIMIIFTTVRPRREIGVGI